MHVMDAKDGGNFAVGFQRQFQFAPMHLDRFPMCSSSDKGAFHERWCGDPYVG
jgi:hypothetical protein